MTTRRMLSTAYKHIADTSSVASMLALEVIISRDSSESADKILSNALESSEVKEYIIYLLRLGMPHKISPLLHPYVNHSILGGQVRETLFINGLDSDTDFIKQIATPKELDHYRSLKKLVK